MTHFGLLCPTASGHLNPMTTLGYELAQRGHRVTLIATLDAQPKAAAAGLDFRAIGAAEFPVGSAAAEINRIGELSGLAAFRSTIALFKKITETLLREAPAVLEAAGVEAVLVDQAAFGGSSVAEHLGLPYVSVCCALMFNREPGVPPLNTSWSYSPAWWARLRNRAGHALMVRLAQPIGDLVNEYRQQWGLPAYQSSSDAYSDLAQICQQPAEFEFPREQLPACFHFTGPYANPASREATDFPFEQLSDQPLIYASLGTVQNQLMDTFEIIAAACADLEAQLVIALGGGSKPEALPNLPGSPIVVAFAPQLALLQRAALTITHAGMNTTLESLSNGVPMVAIPIANDQPGVAARIAWTGTGEVVSLKQLSVPRLRQAIATVLTTDTYRDHARRLQAAIQNAGGVSRAADIVEQAIATRQPVMAPYRSESI
ncbi:MAG: glycosyltransferase [Leptolyngbya sp. SIO4C1]|nr:glycosyltransferase [Leptolyngbya sp. SIO4C1]